MENPAVTTLHEVSPGRITLEVVEWEHTNNCGDNVESYDVTSFSAEDHRQLRAFLEERGAVRRLPGIDS